jgi:hypothetical protein
MIVKLKYLLILQHLFNVLDGQLKNEKNEATPNYRR